MVYGGKPSRGCQMCRTRRIKCDEGRPTCSQCLKSRRQCPGYKDEFDIVFRNETQAVERRARRSSNKRAFLPGEQIMQQDDVEMANATSDMAQFIKADSERARSIRHALTFPVEERAQNFFLANFVLLPAPGSTRGFFDFVIPLMKSEKSSIGLSHSFAAVALAAMGNQPRAKSLLAYATHQYSSALVSVNKALRDPVMQKSDATLAAVLLLGIYETITCRRTNVTAWGTHIEGAVMIVKMRGKKQLRTKIGQSLFASVRQQMIINCMSASKTPDLGIDWWVSSAEKDDPTALLSTKLNLLVAQLRAEINRSMTFMARTPENIQKVLALLQRAEALEKRFSAWIETIPDAWRYESIAYVDATPGMDVGASDVCPGRIDRYADLNMVAVWNNVRVSRLFLGGMIARLAAWICAPMDYRTTPEYSFSSRLGGQMIEDMCASIPVTLGWSPKESPGRPGGGGSQFAVGDDSTETSKSLAGYYAIWPLFTACCSDFASEMQRSWIMGRLKHISAVMGIDQAATFAHYQLRLPSMIIKRDGLGLTSPNAKLLASPAGPQPTAGFPSPAYTSPVPQTTSPSVHTMTTVHRPLSSSPQSTSFSPAYPPSITPVYSTSLQGFSTGPPVDGYVAHVFHQQAQAEREKSEAQVRTQERVQVMQILDASAHGDEVAKKELWKAHAAAYEREKMELLKTATNHAQGGTESMLNLIASYMGTDSMDPAKALEG